MTNKEVKNLKIPGGSNTISILSAIFFAFIIKEIFSPTAQEIIKDEIVTPILNVLLGACFNRVEHYDDFYVNMSGVISLIIRNCDLLDFSHKIN